MSESAQRALIVEDDPSWQQIISEILADSGLVVDVASSFDVALVTLRDVPHRMAVVDLSLGGSDHRNQDGLHLLEAIRRHDPSCVPILLTGFATVELAVSALTEYGAYTCLRKESFRRADFRKLVGQALATAPVAGQGLSPDPVEAVQAAPAVEAKASGGQAGSALIVEDDAGWRGILAELLTEAGLQVRPCSSYGEALGLLRREKLALAVVDLSLASSVAPTGNLDGYHVLANTRAAGIPTIVVSGAGGPEDAERTYVDYGVFAYLEKRSFNRAAFRRTVAEALSSRGKKEGELGLLTQHEREVLDLLAEGMTNKEIAAALVISINTVKRHLKSLFEKLGVNTRAAAAAKAAQK